MHYIRSTKELDSLYAIHPDMRSHSGIIMSLGKGVTDTKSSKQKLNTKSSTEAELMAIYYATAQVLWTRHFLAAQGVYVPTTMTYQVNKGTILLAENCKQSSSRKTPHLNIQYFLVTDKIKKERLR